MSDVDAVSLARSVLDRRSSRTDDEVDQVIRLLVEDVTSNVDAMANIAKWLKARAELAAKSEPDPEQPDAADFFSGSRSGAYNALYLAANAVEDGRAARPRDQWPPYMRGERVHPRQTDQEIDDASPTASS